MTEEKKDAVKKPDSVGVFQLSHNTLANLLKGNPDRLIDRLSAEFSRIIMFKVLDLEKAHPGFKTSISIDINHAALKQDRYELIAEIRLVEPGVCRVCGCTEHDACYNPKYGFCWWANEDRTICSHCAIKKIADDPSTEHTVRPRKQRKIKQHRDGQ